jgi:hypothetical protein
VCHCSDVVHAGDLSLRCCGDSATIVTASDGRGHARICLLHHHSLGPAASRFSIAVLHQCLLMCDQAELGDDESILHASSMKARVAMDGSCKSMHLLANDHATLIGCV